MAAALFLALQAAAVAGPSPIPGIAPIEFDLARHKASNADTDRGCGSGDGSEIVVCGRRRSGPGYPLEEMALLFKAKPIIAQIGIGGGAAVRAYVESVEMPGGQISKRAMIGIKWPF